jgi:sugar lactone lactonase YvrE
MQFLRGETLDDLLKRAGKLPPAEVIRIGRQVAEGLAAAHERGLMHRDIKPANIWLESTRDRVKIVDFGLARAASDESHLTQQGAIVGTPAYMAPEQVDSKRIDCRCDLFSLGCVLYRALTGEAPFKGPDTISTLMAVATYHPPAPQRLDPAVPPGLSALIMQLLAKSPDQRPANTAAVVSALSTLEGSRGRSYPSFSSLRLPSAGPAATNAQTARHRALAWTAAGALLAGVALTVAASLRFAGGHGSLLVSSADAGVELLIKRDDAVLERTARREIEVKPGEYALEVAPPSHGFHAIPEQLTVKRGERYEVRIEKNQESATSLPIRAPQEAANALARLDAGALPPAHHFAGEPREIVAILANHAPVQAVVFDPAGQFLVTGGKDRNVRLWNLATGEATAVPNEHPGRISALAIDPKGRFLASSSVEGTIMLWDRRTNVRRTIKDNRDSLPTAALAFAPDGKLLASGHPGTSPVRSHVKLWDLIDRREPSVSLQGHPAKIFSIAFSPSGDLLAAGSGDGSIYLWEVRTGRESPALHGHKGPVVSLSFGPLGRNLASAGQDGAVKIWDLSTARERVTVTSSGKSRATSIVYSPGGRTLFWADDAGHVTWRQLATAKNLREFKFPQAIHQIAVAGDGEHLAAGCEDGNVYILRLGRPAIPPVTLRDPKAPAP